MKGKKVKWVRLLVIAGVTLGISLPVIRKVEQMVLENAGKVAEREEKRAEKREKKNRFSLIQADNPELQRLGLHWLESKYPYLQMVIEKAKSRHDVVRASAVGWLARMSGEEDPFEIYQPRILEALASSLHDDKTSIRMEATRGIALNKLDRKYQYLSEAIRDGNWIVRRKVAFVLGWQSDLEDRGRKMIKEMLADPDEDVRSAAATALLCIGDDLGIPPILSFLGSRDPFRRFQALDRVRFSKNPALVSHWQQACLDPDPFIRLRAYENRSGEMEKQTEAKQYRLLQMIGLRTTGVAHGLYGYDHWFENWQDYEKAGQVPLEEEDRDALLAGLKGKEPQARRYSALLLRDANAWSGQVAAALLEALRDPEASVRMNAAAALGGLAPPGAFPSLSCLLSDPDPAVRENAVTALGSYRRPEAIGFLLPFLDTGGREMISRVLTSLAKLDLPLPPLPLIRLISANDPLIRAGAALALGRAKGKDALTALRKALGDPDSCVRKNAAIALDGLKWLPQNPQQQAEYWVASRQMKRCVALGKAALPALLVALNDTLEGIRLEAACAAYAIEPDLDPQYYRKSLIDQDGYVNHDILEMIDAVKLTPAQFDLASLLSDHPFSNRDERGSVGWTLKRICDKNAIPSLVKALKESPEQAAWSLEKLKWKPSSDEEKICFYFGSKKWGELEIMMDKAFPYLLEKLKTLERYPVYWDWFNYNGDEFDMEFFKLMARTKDKRVRAILIPFYHKSKIFRFFPDWYANVIGELGGRQAVAALVEMLDHPESKIREQAAKALKKNAGHWDTLFPLFRAAVWDEKKEVRANACEALVQNILIEMLKILVLALLCYWLLKRLFLK